jgi:hypothetical protein
MQDIPRNQLLDNIAQGWTVRRKDWVEAKVFCLHPYKPKGSTVIFLDWAELVHQDDWEGWPPPVCMYSDHSIEPALGKLNKIKKGFVRRKAWQSEEHIQFGQKHISLEPSDILAMDWEVWA